METKGELRMDKFELIWFLTGVFGSLFLSSIFHLPENERMVVGGFGLFILFGYLGYCIIDQYTNKGGISVMAKKSKRRKKKAGVRY